MKKHLRKATAADFLDHVQRAVDKIVLEKDAQNHYVEARMESLREEVEIKTEWIRDRDDYIVTLQEESVRLQEMISKLEEVLRQKDGHIEWLAMKKRGGHRGEPVYHRCKRRNHRRESSNKEDA